jgi:glycosyltransferase involved in cell wall biosynthesis
MNNTKTHLVIDGQIFQTNSWHRGMGKYSLSLIQALYKQKFIQQYVSVTILFNKNIGIEKKVMETLTFFFAQAKFLYVDLGVPAGVSVKNLQPLNKTSLVKAIDKAGIQRDFDYLILSLFLGETCAVFPDSSRKLLLFYDLIPFLYPNRYKSRLNYSDYLKHFKTVFEADIIFTISQTVADDIKVYLGINEDKLCNIDGASIDRSTLSERKPEIKQLEKFILMASGDELRKNNHRAILGFEEFNISHGNTYKIVMTSQYSEHTKEELSQLSKNIIFTGNIPEDELQWLYKNATLLLFASEYEGLGLPVLEGISTDQKIACSDIPVFKEISNDAFYYFDHFNPSSIAQTIEFALFDKDWNKKKDQYKAILEKYSWGNTAQRFVNGLQTLKIENRHTSKPKIAILTPHPAGFSAIGKVVAESHDSFARYFEVDYYFDYAKSQMIRPDYLSEVACCYEAADFNVEKYSKYDAVIYHIGNSDYHLESIKNALYLPGYIILHDTFLEGVFGVLEREQYISNKRFELEKQLDKISSIKTSNFLTSIINNQLGIFTHSHYATNAVNELLENSVPVKKLNLPVSTPVLYHNENKSFFQIGLAGILYDAKGLAIIEEIASSEKFKDCIINIFGFTFVKPEVVEQFKKWSNINIIPNPSDFEFQTKLSKLDVLINYRIEYNGETSLTTLEAMRYGVTVIVRDIGWYSELPDNSVIKTSSEKEVIEKLLQLYQNKNILHNISVNAKTLTKSDFSHDKYVEAIVEMINENKTSELINKKREKIIKASKKLDWVKTIMGY